MIVVKDISAEWLKNYIDQLLNLAKQLPQGKMREATLLRAEHVMDLVEAWKKAN